MNSTDIQRCSLCLFLVLGLAAITATCVSWINPVTSFLPDKGKEGTDQSAGHSLR